MKAVIFAGGYGTRLSEESGTRPKPMVEIGSKPLLCIFDLIKDDSTIWEKEPLQTLATSGHLLAYRHSGFWQCMDTLRDKNYLEGIWQSGNVPWKHW